MTNNDGVCVFIIMGDPIMINSVVCCNWGDPIILIMVYNDG